VTLERFLDATEARDFDLAWRLLAGRLRARYTPARLAEDFAAAPLIGKEKLDRARAALALSPRVDGSTARLPIGQGRAVQMVREADGWKVLALE
jgi:hypothetical protein